MEPNIAHTPHIHTYICYNFFMSYILLHTSGPAREPSDFTVLRNHTSIALTLQWHPGYDGGYPPQTYTLQYSASNKVGRKTWSDIFSYTSDAMTWYQATVTGLQPQTQYVFSLYAENNRPRDKGPNRSLTVTQTGSTTGRVQENERFGPGMLMS